MKLAVVSDIHGNLLALQAVLADIARADVDQIVNLGDILSGPLQPAETADLLMRLGLVTIAGNHERQLLREYAKPREARANSSDGYAASHVSAAQAQWLRALPPQHWLAPDVLLVHGTPASDLENWLETVMPDLGVNGSAGLRAATAEEVRQRLGHEATRASLVLCGHTHMPRVAQCGATLIVNPGSIGLQAYAGSHPHPHRLEVGLPHAHYAIVERTGPRWSVQLRAVAYDWEVQAQLAAQRGRADWAYALATGRMPPPDPTIGA